MRRLLVVAIALVLACGPGSGSSTTAPQAPAGAPAGATPGEATPIGALPSPVPLRIAYSELTPAQFANWVAYEAGIYTRYGLDVTLNYITSAQTTTAIIANEVE